MKLFNKIKVLMRLERIKSQKHARNLINKLSAEYRNAKTPKEKDKVIENFVTINF